MEKNNLNDSITVNKDVTNEEKIKICISLIDKEKYKNLIPLIKKEMENNKFASLGEIKNIQKILN